MKPHVRLATIPFERRKALLLGVPAFAGMPVPVIDELANSLREEHFPLGAIIVAEGEIGDRLYIIDRGEAEVSTPGVVASISLARLAAGDMFGEIALLASNRRRQATVVAQSPVVALSLDADAFERAMDAAPEARLELGAIADTLLSAKFLKQQGAWRA